MNVEQLNSRPARWYTLLGLVLVPILVAGGFLLAGVNSTSRLHTVQAAVVSLDDPVTIDGQYTPLGRQLTSNLVDSQRTENLTWVLDSEENARAGLATGTYAAMVVIPKNFSAAATSFSKDADEAEQATIEVSTSPVAGVADATLGRLVASEAAATLNQTLTESYLTQIYIGFNDLGDQFVTLADGSSQLADGAEKLSDGIGDAADGAGELYTGSSKLANGLQTYAAGVGTLVDESQSQQKALAKNVKKLADGAKGIDAGLGTYQSSLEKNARAAADGADQITGLLTALGQGQVAPEVVIGAIKQACDIDTDAAGLAVNGPVCVASLTASSRALAGAAAGLDQKDPDTGQSLKSGTSALADGVGQLSSALTKAANDEKTAAQLKQLKSGGTKLAGGAAELASGIDQFEAGLIDAHTGSTKLADGIRKMADGIAEGKDKLPSYTKSDRENLSTVVASPIDTSALSGLANPNIGWISLVLVLALWLGALATYAMVKAIGAGLLHSSEPTLVLIGRALLPGIAVVGTQAILVAALSRFGLDLDGREWLAITGVLVLAGITFVVVNHALVAWWGGFGRLVSVLLAVLTAASALTGAAPAVFAALRPFSPLTPALDAVRAILTESSGAVTSTLTLVGWLLVALTASAVAVARKRSTTLSAVVAGA
ncbi:MAG: YhgE/Pip family protein [Actinobacteria bacterium]|nr:YhgE/Pip family protein [Actinomycetota bacterium]